MIGGIFLFWFFDALFFTMFIKEEYGEGVDSIGDLIERDMSLGTGCPKKNRDLCSGVILGP